MFNEPTQELLDIQKYGQPEWTKMVAAQLQHALAKA